jgi:hypothetical protein
MLRRVRRVPFPLDRLRDLNSTFGAYQGVTVDSVHALPISSRVMSIAWYRSINATTGPTATPVSMTPITSTMRSLDAREFKQRQSWA